jgi:hypothetical protein
MLQPGAEHPRSLAATTLRAPDGGPVFRLAPFGGHRIRSYPLSVGERRLCQ